MRSDRDVFFMLGLCFGQLTACLLLLLVSYDYRAAILNIIAFATGGILVYGGVLLLRGRRQ